MTNTAPDVTANLTGGLTADEFKEAFRHHPAGVVVITADAGEGPVGLTASSVFSVSADPALLVFSVGNQASAAATLKKADTLVLHMLLDAQLPLAKLCSTSGVDRFADTTLWDRLPTGEPFFHNVPARIRGKVLSKTPAGSSTIFLVHALESEIAEDCSTAKPLVYYNRGWHALSEASKLEG
jgi:flavin reductase (DIM6/NTAB) family NADH-FMN oxidoreductase RutF